QPLQPDGRLGPIVAGDMLVERLARAHAKIEAARIHRFERGGGLRQNRRMVAWPRSGDSGAEDDATGLRSQRSQPCPDERRLPLLRRPGMKVVGGHNAAETSILGLARPAE